MIFENKISSVWARDYIWSRDIDSSITCDFWLRGNVFLIVMMSIMSSLCYDLYVRYMQHVEDMWWCLYIES